MRPLYQNRVTFRAESKAPANAVYSLPLPTYDLRLRHCPLLHPLSLVLSPSTFIPPFLPHRTVDKVFLFPLVRSWSPSQLFDQMADLYPPSYTNRQHQSYHRHPDAISSQQQQSYSQMG